MIERLRSLSPREIIALVGLAGAAAIVAGASFGAATSKDSWISEFWFEVAKAGVQLMAVGVLGGALAAGWRSIENHRQIRTQERDQLRAELDAMVDLYMKVKTIRRRLFSLGFDREAGSLTRRQAEGFEEQMLLLNDVQLSFEIKKRRYGRTDPSVGRASDVEQSLARIEKHLNNILDFWEAEGFTVEEGSDVQPIRAALQPLLRQEKFKPAVSEPLKEIADAMNKLMLAKV